MSSSARVVPADIRLLGTAGLECDEAVLTGESIPSEKSPEPVSAGAALAKLSSCALMGTVCMPALGIVWWWPPAAAEFGRIALGLGEHQPQTEF